MLDSMKTKAGKIKKHLNRNKSEKFGSKKSRSKSKR